MENNKLDKILDVAGNATKIAANLSEAKKDIPKPLPQHQVNDDSNNASTGSQNIQIHMDSGKRKEPKPVEKHIHEFPDNRPLTELECNLALEKAKMEYNLKLNQQAYFEKTCDRDWQHQMELEKKRERKDKVRKVIGGILVALGIGTVGYGVYSDYKKQLNKPVAQPQVQPKLPEPINTEGEVK